MSALILGSTRLAPISLPVSGVLEYYSFLRIAPANRGWQLLLSDNLFLGADLYFRFITVKLNRTYDLHLFALQIRKIWIRGLRCILWDPNHESDIWIRSAKIEKNVPIPALEHPCNRSFHSHSLTNMLSRFRVGNQRLSLSHTSKQAKSTQQTREQN